MTRDDFFRDYITTWEGGLSVDPDDSGNWYTCKGGEPVLCGSKYGVTGAALASFRGCTTIAPADITGLTLDEAVRLGERMFYDQPGFDLLPWDPLVASAVDFGWGAGPKQSVILLQRMIAVAEDGAVGPFTAHAYAQFVASHGIETAAAQWHAARDAYYATVVARRPVNAKYLRGWQRRSAYFAPPGAWWKRFTGAAA